MALFSSNGQLRFRNSSESMNESFICFTWLFGQGISPPVLNNTTQNITSKLLCPKLDSNRHPNTEAVQNDMRLSRHSHRKQTNHNLSSVNKHIDI
jgi:hypothetical protein